MALGSGCVKAPATGQNRRAALLELHAPIVASMHSTCHFLSIGRASHHPSALLAGEVTSTSQRDLTGVDIVERNDLLAGRKHNLEHRHSEQLDFPGTTGQMEHDTRHELRVYESTQHTTRDPRDPHSRTTRSPYTTTRTHEHTNTQTHEDDKLFGQPHELVFVCSCISRFS